MLTRLHIRNFKRFDDVSIDLDRVSVFVGPNNSGKTTALQALALWELGLRRWTSERRGDAIPSKRPGVSINRRDVLAAPVPLAKLLWRDVHTREAERKNGKPVTRNVRIDVAVEGVAGSRAWSCGFEFDYQNDESLICRPRRKAGFEHVPVSEAEFESVSDDAKKVGIAYLPPMSGLAAVEPMWEAGRVNVLLGEGQTAQVLRNLCHGLRSENPAAWEKLTAQIESLFNVTLLPPIHIAERGEITMQYRERGIALDLACAGRGLQQTMLLLAYLYGKSGAVVLLDEPDAHLEILRQREIYGLLSEVANAQDSQIIAASHSEVILNEAAEHDCVVAFVGKPHPLNRGRAQLAKALTEIGWQDYLKAEMIGWVLYLEGPSDLRILQGFAARLQHPAAALLTRCFAHYVSLNKPKVARDHFNGLREAKPDLRGLAIFDRLESPLSDGGPLTEVMWHRREIENYLTTRNTLLRFAADNSEPDLVLFREAPLKAQAMEASIDEIARALRDLKDADLWSPEAKASDDVLKPIFKKYAEAMRLPLLGKGEFSDLVRFVPDEEIDPEIVEKLDLIVAVAALAKPAS